MNEYEDIFESARVASANKYVIEALFRTPGARWDNDEYFTRSPLRTDKSIGSFHISAKGQYFDHATNEGGDLIKLVELTNNLKPIDAAKKILETAGVSISKELENPFEPLDEETKEEFEPVIPIPQEAFNSLESTVTRQWYQNKWGTYNQFWTYRTSGGPWCAAVRFDKPTQENPHAKEVIPFQFSNDGKWHAKRPINQDIPLFNQDQLTPGVPVLIVEGEKCATVQLSTYTLITWMGGATKGVKKANWSVLNNYAVTIWPDNDEPGLLAALEIVEFVPHASILHIPKDKPKKWDIYDAFEEGINISNFIAECPTISKSADIINEGEFSLTIPTNKDNFLSLDTPQKIRAIFENYYSFRRNVLTSKIEFRLKNSDGPYTIMDDIQQNDLLFLLRKTGAFKSLSKNHFEEVIFSSFSKNYSPIHSYFSSLPKWDGTDYIQELANLIEIKQGQHGEGVESNDVWYDYLKRWLAGSTAQMLGRGDNHMCLTLLGKQGRGKTTFLKNLGITKDLTYIGAIDPTNKDSLTLYGEKTLIVLDELEASTRRDIASIKSNMTLPEVCVRRPYDRHATTLKRIANFTASANNIDVLSDLSGSRRWLCLETGNRIEYQKVTPELMRKVYSQCVALLDEGYEYWMHLEEIERFSSYNDQFQEACPEKDLLTKHFIPAGSQPDITSQAERLTNTEIVSLLSQGYKMKLSQKKLGHIMKELGFIKIKEGERRPYIVQRTPHLIPGEVRDTISGTDSDYSGQIVI